jgi:hypothetical protein
MSFVINKIELLSALESTQSGLSSAELALQSDRFVFKNGRVITFNREVCCRVKGPLPAEVCCAVAGGSLLEGIRRIPDDELVIQITSDTFAVTGSKSKLFADANLDPAVTLQYDVVDKPEEWSDLPVDFGDALGLVGGCAAKNSEPSAVLRRVHFDGRFAQASDRHQMARYEVPLQCKLPFQIHRDAVKCLASLGCSRFAETEGWVHFKNPDGLVVSCCRYTDPFPSLSTFFEIRGEGVTLPKDLIQATDLAGKFSGENKADDHVRVDLRPGKVRVVGTGYSGKGGVRGRKLKYDGPPLSFRISPETFKQVVDKYSECEITEEALRIDGGSWTLLMHLKGDSQKNGEKHE